MHGVAQCNVTGKLNLRACRLLVEMHVVYCWVSVSSVLALDVKQALELFLPTSESVKNIFKHYQ